MTVLIDTNILLDYLQNRPEYKDADTLITLCADKKISGFIAAHSIPDMFYIMRKSYSEGERREMLLDIVEIVPVIAIDQKKISEALKNTDFSDFEDCLQSECALSAAADYIITRNKDNFRQSAVKAVTPADFIRKLDSFL